MLIACSNPIWIQNLWNITALHFMDHYYIDIGDIPHFKRFVYLHAFMAIFMSLLMYILASTSFMPVTNGKKLYFF